MLGRFLIHKYIPTYICSVGEPCHLVTLRDVQCYTNSPLVSPPRTEVELGKIRGTCLAAWCVVWVMAPDGGGHSGDPAPKIAAMSEILKKSPGLPTGTSRYVRPVLRIASF